jgi:dTMP kinase
VRPRWLFSFEGLDGVGKTTQIALVKAWLADEGYDVLVVREPGGTPWGEMIRQMVLRQAQSHDATAEFLLFASARAELVRTGIRPWLDQGGIVLADRYVDSSEAYQGWGGGASCDLIRQVNQAITEGASPRGTLWLDGPRRLNPGDEDNLESRGAPFFTKVEDGYRAIWDRDSARVCRIDAASEAATVFEAVRHAIRSWMKEDVPE